MLADIWLHALGPAFGADTCSAVTTVHAQQLNHWCRDMLSSWALQQELPGLEEPAAYSVGAVLRPGTAVCTAGQQQSLRCSLQPREAGRQHTQGSGRP